MQSGFQLCWRRNLARKREDSVMVPCPSWKVSPKLRRYSRCGTRTAHCTGVSAGAAATRAPTWAPGLRLPGPLPSRTCPDGEGPPPSVNLLVFSRLTPRGFGGGRHQYNDSRGHSCQRSRPEVRFLVPRTHLPPDPVAVLGGGCQNGASILQTLCRVPGSQLRVQSRAMGDTKNHGLCSCAWGM